LTIFYIHLINKSVIFHGRHKIVWVIPNFWTVVYIWKRWVLKGDVKEDNDVACLIFSGKSIQSDGPLVFTLVSGPGLLRWHLELLISMSLSKKTDWTPIPLLSPIKGIEILLQAQLNPADPLNSRDLVDLCCSMVWSRHRLCELMLPIGWIGFGIAAVCVLGYWPFHRDKTKGEFLYSQSLQLPVLLPRLGSGFGTPPPPPFNNLLLCVAWGAAGCSSI